MTVEISSWKPNPKRNNPERLQGFINEVANQASILLMERHLMKRDALSPLERAEYKQRFNKKLVQLLSENNSEFAISLFGPQDIKPGMHVTYYENAARKLADYAEKLWKKTAS